MATSVNEHLSARATYLRLSFRFPRQIKRIRRSATIARSSDRFDYSPSSKKSVVGSPYSSLLNVDGAPCLGGYQIRLESESYDRLSVREIHQNIRSSSLFKSSTRTIHILTARHGQHTSSIAKQDRPQRATTQADKESPCHYKQVAQAGDPALSGWITAKKELRMLGGPGRSA